MKKVILIFSLLVSLFAYAEVPLKIVKISDSVYGLEGETKQRSAENFGNNSTHGVIVTDAGVILIDSGASFLGAKQIHNAIKTFTDKAIKIVINTGGQDHRWLGNDYFKSLGAKIISSKKTNQDQKNRSDYHLNRLQQLIGESLKGTKPVYADEIFSDKKNINFGGVKLELYHFGAAHTIGDILVWMPSKKIMFSGDVVFVDRALGTGPAKNIKSWIKVFEKMASFQPKVIIPGHGRATNLKTATQDTYNYLVYLRDKIRELIENDGDMQTAININQSQFKYLKNFNEISRRNAQNTFEQLEFE